MEEKPLQIHLKMPDKIHILSTRALGEDLLEQAEGAGIAVDEIPFIETEPIESVEVQQEIESVMVLDAVVIFTSMNAVEAVAGYLIDEQPSWHIYCIGQTTEQLVKKYFPLSELVATADSAAALAEKIIEDKALTEVYFFCGNQRRDEIPSILTAHDIAMNEIIVYQTIPLPQKIKTSYKAILFFSPSAVDSFFVKNIAEEGMIFFAIGQTTANTIRKYTSNKIITPDHPGKESLFEKMIEYFGG